MSHISHGTSGAKGRMDFDLNIVPIVDCLTILVTFMLAAGAYYTLAMLEVKVNAGGASSGSMVQAVDINVDVKVNRDIIFKMSGHETKAYTIRAKQGKPDLDGLSVLLTEVSKKWTQVDSATLSAQRDVSYQDVVNVLEQISKTHPDVALGGF